LRISANGYIQQSVRICSFYDYWSSTNFFRLKEIESNLYT